MKNYWKGFGGWEEEGVDEGWRTIGNGESIWRTEGAGRAREGTACWKFKKGTMLGY